MPALRTIKAAANHLGSKFLRDHYDAEETSGESYGRAAGGDTSERGTNLGALSAVAGSRQTMHDRTG